MIAVGIFAWVLVGLFALALSRAADDDDWRDGWCTWDCWAPDGQRGPCEDCPWARGRR